VAGGASSVAAAHISPTTMPTDRRSRPCARLIVRPLGTARAYLRQIANEPAAVRLHRDASVVVNRDAFSVTPITDR
jgi:hypothetical protein